MAGYAHARHHLPQAFFCGYCRKPVGVPCPASIYHAVRRRLVPNDLPNDLLDKVIQMILDLQQLRRGGPSAGAAAAALEKEITDLMIRIKNNESITV